MPNTLLSSQNLSHDLATISVEDKVHNKNKNLLSNILSKKKKKKKPHDVAIRTDTFQISP